MKNRPFFLIIFILGKGILVAQQTADTTTVSADFSYTANGNAITFTPILPAFKTPVAGAPKPFYSYHWEFGDGDFSSEENPKHLYAADGDYLPILYATNSYDDGKTPLGGKKKVKTKGAVASTDIKTVFKEPHQAIALKAIRGARKNEELVLIMSYQNARNFDTDGELHFFYNEKIYASNHFTFLEGRTHFGEKLLTTEVGSATEDIEKDAGWSSLFIPQNGITVEGTGMEGMIPSEKTDAARKMFRDEKTWAFPYLKAGEKRNMFISLKGTDNMLNDTSGIIHVRGVFVPNNSAIPSEEFTLEIEIVSSHDPNGIMVSDVRVNYRLIKVKDIDYKVKFQNNGEGPAQKVEVAITIPEGLNMAKARPVDWYPKCPVCPKDSTTKSCLKFTTTDKGIVFTFQNIYLPGSHQKGVTEYDSSKGFVKYSIVPEKDMPKRPFRSQAKIVFDKNPPIFTNYSKTRFKTGFSPGPKAGYGIYQADADPNDPFRAVTSKHYYFLGCTFSPYKSWRVYPQAEILTGIQNRQDIGEQAFHTFDTTSLIIVNGALPYKLRDSTADYVTTGSRGFISLEIPLSIRKNFNRWIGAGLGFSTWVLFDNGQDQTKGSYVIGHSTADGVDATGQLIWVKDVSEPVKIDRTTTYADTRLRYSVFADVNIGLVRAGPYLGIRGGYLLGGDKLRPFLQVSMGVKL